MFVCVCVCVNVCVCVCVHVFVFPCLRAMRVCFCTLTNYMWCQCVCVLALALCVCVCVCTQTKSWQVPELTLVNPVPTHIQPQLSPRVRLILMPAPSIKQPACMPAVRRTATKSGVALHHIASFVCTRCDTHRPQPNPSYRTRSREHGSR